MESLFSLIKTRAGEPFAMRLGNLPLWKGIYHICQRIHADAGNSLSLSRTL